MKVHTVGGNGVAAAGVIRPGRAICVEAWCLKDGSQESKAKVEERLVAVILPGVAGAGAGATVGSRGSRSGSRSNSGRSMKAHTIRGHGTAAALGVIGQGPRQLCGSVVLNDKRLSVLYGTIQLQAQCSVTGHWGLEQR